MAKAMKAMKVIKAMKTLVKRDAVSVSKWIVLDEFFCWFPLESVQNVQWIRMWLSNSAQAMFRMVRLITSY